MEPISENPTRQSYRKTYRSGTISFKDGVSYPTELKGKMALEVGCGAGRYAEIALSLGAKLVALDYSSAVDTCWQNLHSNPNLNVVQGDIYHLPFKPASFKSVYCFGVLQHTPDVGKAFLALPPQL